MIFPRVAIDDEPPEVAYYARLSADPDAIRSWNDASSHGYGALLRLLNTHVQAVDRPWKYVTIRRTGKGTFVLWQAPVYSAGVGDAKKVIPKILKKTGLLVDATPAKMLDMEGIASMQLELAMDSMEEKPMPAERVKPTKKNINAWLEQKEAGVPKRARTAYVTKPALKWMEDEDSPLKLLQGEQWTMVPTAPTSAIVPTEPASAQASAIVPIAPASAQASAIVPIAPASNLVSTPASQLATPMENIPTITSIRSPSQDPELYVDIDGGIDCERSNYEKEENEKEEKRRTLWAAWGPDWDGIIRTKRVERMKEADWINNLLAKLLDGVGAAPDFLDIVDAAREGMSEGTLSHVNDVASAGKKKAELMNRAKKAWENIYQMPMPEDYFKDASDRKKLNQNGRCG